MSTALLENSIMSQWHDNIKDVAAKTAALQLKEEGRPEDTLKLRSRRTSLYGSCLE